MKEYLVLCLVLCAGGLSGAAFAGPCYDVEILYGPTCPIFGPENVHPEDIASDGTVIGSTGSCDDGARGFVWPMVDEPYLIAPPTGVTSLTANCINGQGQVGVQFGIPGLAHVYDLASGSFTPIGVPPGGGSHIVAYGINNDSDVVGEGGMDIDAFAVIGGRMIDLALLLTGPNSIARDINDHGSVVGWTGSILSSASSRGFIYHDGIVTDFGVAPGCFNSSARAVNAHDEVACTASEPIPGDLIGHAFIWREGNWKHLDHLPGYQDMNANDINDHGVVVGGAFTPGATDFVWVEGVTYDLNQRIPADSGVYIESARAVNNAGQIACEGTTQHPFFGFSRVGVRLTPRSPQPADFTDDCTVNGEDLTILLQSWGPILPSAPSGGGRGAGSEAKRNANPAADLDGNGIVNGFDLALLLGAWG